MCSYEQGIIDCERKLAGVQLHDRASKLADPLPKLLNVNLEVLHVRPEDYMGVKTRK